ncbi:hypothetical protein DSL72_005162 [Monilinia vaccinii-corymbosi]|uniref:O-methyltransferase C-terminal domain-containing protein n=1 Tax=Monilinia vaccinii-corymbosi TaxID=61207 RepID=A0A8A3PEW8_9HELO|nr:hypothetical protein DSL72_005162 [Monilinia vaccinii-corymbosi]
MLAPEAKVFVQQQHQPYLSGTFLDSLSQAGMRAFTSFITFSTIWSDYKCLEILRNLKQAMKAGYSKLLLFEMIVLEQGVLGFLDLTLMAFDGGMERTGKRWGDLLGKAGFELVELHRPAEGADSDGIVEAVVRE